MSIHPTHLHPLSSQDNSLPLFERYFQDYDAVKENTRDILCEAWQKNILPEGWIRKDFTDHDNGMTFPCYRADAGEPWLEIRFALGLNATAFAYRRAVSFMNSIGISVVMMELPNTGLKTEFMPAYVKGNHRFYNDDSLPIHQTSKPRIPRLQMDHSTNGLCTGLNELQESKRLENSRKFIGAISMASFFALAGASKLFHPRRRQAFNRMSHPDTIHLRTEETRIGRYYSSLLKVLGEPQVFSSTKNPPYAAIFELVAYAEYYVDALLNKDQSSGVKRLYIVPKNDTVACPKTLKKVADLLGGETFKMKNYHNPLLESPEKLMRRLVQFAFEQLGDVIHDLPTQRAEQFLEESLAAKAERKWLKTIGVLIPGASKQAKMQPS
ncbi:MAG: hypothetical protein AAF549_07430 [Pseudomonadota bacterium]